MYNSLNVYLVLGKTNDLRTIYGFEGHTLHYKVYCSLSLQFDSLKSALFTEFYKMPVFREIENSLCDSGLPYTHYTAQTNLQLSDILLPQSLNAGSTGLTLSLAMKKTRPCTSFMPEKMFKICCYRISMDLEKTI